MKLSENPHEQANLLAIRRPRNERFSGTYTVNADCTGTATYSDGTRYDQFIAPDGSELTFVLTKPSEGVTSAFELQVTAKRVGD